MGALFGFVAGYIVGVRAGPQAFEELKDAWQTIRESEEVKELLAGGLAIVGDLLSRGRDLVSDQVEEQRRALSPVA
jgi:hypothetical protein